MGQDFVFFVVGADNNSNIGSALVNTLLKTGEKVFKTTQVPTIVSSNTSFLDLSCDLSYWEPPANVTVSYICAAVSSFNECRIHPSETAIINVQNTLAVARKLISNGCFVVFLSTSAVFDGSVPFNKANDPTNPQTEYGRQKAAVEKVLLTLGKSSAVARLTKVVSPQTALFKNWITSLHNNHVINPFSDMVMAPLPLPYVVDVLYRIGNSLSPGIFQVSATEDITYEQAGRYIAKRIGVDQNLIQPIRGMDLEIELETIPKHTTLDTGRVNNELGLPSPNPWSAIEYILEHNRLGT